MVDDLRLLPPLTGTALDRAGFTALLASHPAAYGWQIRLDAADAVMLERAHPRRPDRQPAHVLFVRCLKPGAVTDVQRDYRRVWVYDVAGTLRTTAQTADDLAFVDDLYARARPALALMLQERERRVADAIASAPAIESETLVDAIAAMVHRRADPAPIAEAVLLAAHDPWAYVRSSAAACAERGIHEPVAGLHVIALLQHLPPAHLLEVDWKAPASEVLPLLAGVLRAGPDLALDADAWLTRLGDRRSPLAALKAVASTLPGAALLRLAYEADAYAFVCVPAADAARLRTWKKKAGLPLTLLR